MHLVGGRLVLESYLIGQHPNYSKVEVFLDIRYFPGLENNRGSIIKKSIS